jgi:hypothetical protein
MSARELELLVEVAKDHVDALLQLLEVGRGEKLVQRKVLHQDVVVVDCQETRGQYGP